MSPTKSETNIVTDAGAAEFLLSSDWIDDDDGAALSAEFWGVYVNDEWWMHHHEVNDRARRLIRGAVAAERERLRGVIAATLEKCRGHAPNQFAVMDYEEAWAVSEAVVAALGSEVATK